MRKAKRGDGDGDVKRDRKRRWEKGVNRGGESGREGEREGMREGEEKEGGKGEGMREGEEKEGGRERGRVKKMKSRKREENTDDIKCRLKRTLISKDNKRNITYLSPITLTSSLYPPSSSPPPPPLSLRIYASQQHRMSYPDSSDFEDCDPYLLVKEYASSRTFSVLSFLRNSPAGG